MSEGASGGSERPPAGRGHGRNRVFTSEPSVWNFSVPLRTGAYRTAPDTRWRLVRRSKQRWFLLQVHMDPSEPRGSVPVICSRYHRTNVIPSINTPPPCCWHYWDQSSQRCRVNRNSAGTLQELYRSSRGTLQELYKNITGTLEELYRNITGTLEECYMTFTGTVKELCRSSTGACMKWDCCLLRFFQLDLAWVHQPSISFSCT